MCQHVFGRGVPKHVDSGPFKQVRAPGTPVIPTQKVVDFLGIRVMEGGRQGDLLPALQHVISNVDIRVRKISAAAIVSIPRLRYRGAESDPLHLPLQMHGSLRGNGREAGAPRR